MAILVFADKDQPALASLPGPVAILRLVLPGLNPTLPLQPEIVAMAFRVGGLARYRHVDIVLLAHQHTRLATSNTNRLTIASAYLLRFARNSVHSSGVGASVAHLLSPSHFSQTCLLNRVAA